MIQIHEYTDTNGRSPFADWFNDLDAPVAAKIAAAIIRLEQGNFSNAKGVGAGVSEFRIDSGPGYRIYFGKDGERLVILLAGGTKKRQQQDIENAQARWADYKQRKRHRGDK
ncbi:type II toxin-antitoxin system RelE/ParE family toxin [Methylomonas koyamae]|uniref:type II toxin-antitoxin system RelE/ParE family toxin n=1 Tax=Methylomonas koyamae TaxID=702114 RepID=UPI002873478F|nr:type II toxin-antitoxin system RelE/ParE family toxin [Methylomonas koyamae]WNB76391.1 type II toxin-antitoxin system RelE/ParE family toxin [Methylomonas koyamae]